MRSTGCIGCCWSFPRRGKQFLSSHQAGALIATIKPRDLVGKTRRRLAVELIVELESIDKKINAINNELTELVEARGSTVMTQTRIGPSGTDFDANKQPARPPWKPCEPSNDGSPTSSTPKCWSTRGDGQEGTGRRLCNPASLEAGPRRLGMDVENLHTDHRRTPVRGAFDAGPLTHE